MSWKRAQALETSRSNFKSSSASNQLTDPLQGAQPLWDSVFLPIKWGDHSHLAVRIRGCPATLGDSALAALRLWVQHCPLRPWKPSGITRKKHEGA